MPFFVPISDNSIKIQQHHTQISSKSLSLHKFLQNICPTEIGKGLLYQISPKLVKNWKVGVEINCGAK
jgi:hypothetical protein